MTTYAVTPTLWVGRTFPAVSGPKVMLASSSLSAEDQNVDEASAAILGGSTVIVPTIQLAYQILRRLGLSIDDAEDRIRFALRGQVPSE